MADTIRELIIRDIMTKLSTLTGYGDVHRGRTFFDHDELPCIAVLPGVETAERQYGQQFCEMPVTIYAIQVVGEGNNASVISEEILGNLILNIIGGRGDVARVNDIAYAGGGVEEYPGPDEQAVSVQVDLVVNYCTNIGDPCSQTEL